MRQRLREWRRPLWRAVRELWVRLRLAVVAAPLVLVDVVPAVVVGLVVLVQVVPLLLPGSPEHAQATPPPPAIVATDASTATAL